MGSFIKDVIIFLRFLDYERPLWEKSRLKSTFLPYRVRKHHFTLEMDSIKAMLLLSYPVCSIKKLIHVFKNPLLDVEEPISYLTKSKL